MTPSGPKVIVIRESGRCRRLAHHRPRSDHRDDAGERCNRDPAGDAAACRTRRRIAGDAGRDHRRRLAPDASSPTRRGLRRPTDTVDSAPSLDTSAESRAACLRRAPAAAPSARAESRRSAPRRLIPRMAACPSPSRRAQRPGPRCHCGHRPVDPPALPGPDTGACPRSAPASVSARAVLRHRGEIRRAHLPRDAEVEHLGAPLRASRRCWRA